MTLQTANIARDGRHMVTPCGFSDVQRCKPHWTTRGERGRWEAAGSRALADAERVAEAAQPGRKWMGLMKRSRANGVGPSPGVFFHQPPTGRMGGLCLYR